MNTLEEYTELLARIDRINSAVSLLQWDQRTKIPRDGHAGRAETLGTLSRMAFELATSDRLGALLDELRGRDGLSPVEQASLRVVGRDYARHKAIPPDLFERFTVARVRSESAWELAKEASDFPSFSPHLSEMIDFARQFAELFGYEDAPYDALLEEYEPGMTARTLRSIIEPLREALVPLLRHLIDDGTPPETSFLEGCFDVSAQRQLAARALQAIGYDFRAGRLDDTTHPFTIGIGPGDTRVTNRYHEDLVLSGLFSALHEGGHALYDQGIPDELRPLGIADGSSYGVHESQSRLWENMVGRSLPFWRHFRAAMVDVFPALDGCSAEEFYAATNTAQPSLIRVEADEVTYNLHIMLRFELEQALLSGDLAVDDAPDAWREGIRDTLGVEPTCDADGVLQDVHWSAGMFAYFPSYMLGNLYAAQLYATARRENQDLESSIEQGDPRVLLGWLRERIHRHGQIFDPVELIERVTGEAPSPVHFIDYLTEKYSAVYGL
ncbi:MAG: carboxypeptidase M32 [Candidatus Bipolaricaulota bacterium]|nr:MAG: carboxypeptidase M32 [Candidatus Bipolaricaulota bacterium]